MEPTGNALLELFTRNAREHGSGVAVLADGASLTHAQFLDKAERLTGGLAAAGVVQGDRIAVLAGNRPEVLLLLAAVARLGAILVPVNMRMSAAEIQHVLSDASPSMVAAEAAYTDLSPALPGLRYTFGDASPGWQAFADLSGGQADAPDAGRAGDGVLLIYTAAVGGQQRGALLSQGNLAAASRQMAQRLGLGAGDVLLGALPLYHVAGIGFALACQFAGGATALMERFDAPAAVQAIDASRITVCVTFSPILGALLDAAQAARTALASLRVVCGLEAPDTIARLEAQCPSATFWSAYGQTETSGSICLVPYRERPGAVGQAIAPTVVSVANQPALVGEILVKGPVVFLGWWDGETRRAIAPAQEWHRTGDLGRIDEDGHLWYTGRTAGKALIKSGGENVYPQEVEDALLAHPAVAAAVVFGVPDPRWGEAVIAACVRQDDAAIDTTELAEFVASRIARFKRPRRIAFLDSIPALADGTADRKQVEAMVARLPAA